MITKFLLFIRLISINENWKKWINNFYSFIFVIISIVLIHNLLKVTIFRELYETYSRYNGGLSGQKYNPYHDGIINITSNVWLISITVILMLSIVFIYIYAIYKKTKKNLSIVRIIINHILPLSAGITLVAWYADDLNIIWYVYFLGGLYAFSSYILLLSEFEITNIEFIKKICNFYKIYVVIFLIATAIFLPFFSLGQKYGDLYFDNIGAIIAFIIILFFFICIYWFLIRTILTYAWMEVEYKTMEAIGKNIIRTGIILGLVFLILYLHASWRSSIIEQPLLKDTKDTILQENNKTIENIILKNKNNQ